MKLRSWMTGAVVLMASSASLAQPAPTIDAPPPAAPLPQHAALPTAPPPAPPSVEETASVAPIAALPAKAAEAGATTAPVLFAPASPAFDAIGASPTTVARPATIQSMGASLLSYIDQHGRVNAGVALEAAPLWLFLGQDITLKSWQTNYGDRAISRLSFSFASSANATGLTNISQGLRFVIWDGMDPRWDAQLAGCVSNSLLAALPKRAGGKLPNSQADEALVVEDAGVKTCQTAARERVDERIAGTSAGAFSTAVTEVQGQNGKATFGKYFAWFSALGNLGSGARWLSILGSARYVFNHPGHELDVAVRLRAGNSSMGLSLDGGWTPRTDTDHEFRPKSGVVGLNGELRLSDSTWFAATAGGKFGADSGAAPDLFSVLHFKFATESAARITPITPP